MKSNLTDRLKRLHSTRVRAHDGDAVVGVFEADDRAEASVAMQRDEAAPPATTPPAGPVTEQLRRHRDLAARSRRPAGEPPRSSAAPRGASRGDGTGLGEHLSNLRNAAQMLLDAGSVEAAIPLLHEMASLSPTNPFPLAELARYYRASGRLEWAEVYEARLAATAPY